MSRKHYHVLGGMPGYLPDMAYVCATLTEARALAAYEARLWRDEYDDDQPVYRVSGSAKRGYYDISRRDGTGADYYIEINECCEPICSESDNENS